MILVISDDSKGEWGKMLQEAASSIGERVVHFSADALDIEPCAACGSCSGKTYGRCVIPDDMQQVLPKMICCRVLVFVSPVVFGGVSHHIKKVMDRMSAVGNPRYKVKDGEMVKGTTGQGFKYCMVGIGDNLSEEERSAFLFLHAENRNIMDVEGQAFIVGRESDEVLLDKIVKEICRE